MNNITTILEFDQHRFEGHPPLGTLVIHISGFATTKIVGFDPKEARLVVNVIKIIMGEKDGRKVRQNLQASSIRQSWLKVHPSQNAYLSS